MKQFPTGLADSCEAFVGKLLRVRLNWGWGWHHIIDGVQQISDFEESFHVGKLAVHVERFLRDGRTLRGLVGTVHAGHHRLHGSTAVLFTLSDGLDFNFRENICMAWSGRFGQGQPPDSPGTIPEFPVGTVYVGYATVYEDESHLRECQDRLNRKDPRKAGGW